MLKCKICGFKTLNKTTMHSHISSAHRSTVIRDCYVPGTSESNIIMSASVLEGFFDGSCDTESKSVEDQFSGGGGSFGGGGSSGSWDDSSSSSSSDSGSSCDSGCSGD